jgi:2-keto-4-pentenoate hydratase/2-oxohepta-3-ene-1,7-dioic acid hydratase in catechol pathway
VGEWFSKEDFHDIDSVSFRLDKNGQTVQSGNSSQMLWKINELIAYCSQFFTLKIGDIIFTGTPAGVGSVAEGDLLEGYLESREAFTIKIK